MNIIKQNDKSFVKESSLQLSDNHKITSDNDSKLNEQEEIANVYFNMQHSIFLETLMVISVFIFIVLIIAFIKDGKVFPAIVWIIDIIVFAISYFLNSNYYTQTVADKSKRKIVKLTSFFNNVSYKTIADFNNVKAIGISVSCDMEPGRNGSGAKISKTFETVIIDKKNNIYSLGNSYSQEFLKQPTQLTAEMIGCPFIGSNMDSNIQIVNNDIKLVPYEEVAKKNVRSSNIYLFLAVVLGILMTMSIFYIASR